MKYYFCPIIKKLIAFYTIILLSSSLYAYNNTYTTPYLENYTRIDYKAASQNWAICFDEKGYIYFGNEQGLLVYDSDQWKIHHTENNLVVKSLYYDKESKRIYSGGYRDFGYWKYDEFGILKYKSIVPDSIKTQMGQEMIWEISKTKSSLYFQSYQNIYIQDVKSQEWTIIHNTECLTHNVIHDTLYTFTTNKGIIKIIENKINVIPNTKSINNLLFFLPWKHNSIFIGSQHDGIFILKNNKLTPWNTEANKILLNKNINRGIIVNNDLCLIGTLDDGIYLISTDGKIIRHINQKSGLVNNTILDMDINKNNDIYLATDNGISVLHFNAEVEYIIDIKNNPGHITQVFKTDNYTYVGTNNGLFYFPNNENSQKFSFNHLIRMNLVNGHIWYIKKYDNTIFCGANNGIFEIKDDKANLISNDGGGSTSLIKLPKENGYLSTNYYRMGIIKKHYSGPNKGKFYCQGLIEGFNNTCTTAIFDTQDRLWTCGEQEGLFQMNIDSNKLKATSIKTFDESQGLYNPFSLNIFCINGHIIIVTSNGFYIYDTIEEKLIPYKRFNALFQKNERFTNIAIQDDHHVWVCSSNSAMLVEYHNENYKIIKTYLFTGKYSFPDKFQNISILKDQVIFCLENGIGIIKKNTSYNYRTYPLVITKVQSISKNTPKTLPVIPNNTNVISLNASSNNIHIFYKSANYTPNVINYQWRIYTSKNKKSDWNQTTREDLFFNNLKANTYTLEIKAIYYKDKESATLRYNFEVKDPFLLTNTGIAIIIIILLIIILSTFKLYKHLLYINQRKLEIKHAKEIKEKKSNIKELQNNLMKKEVERMHSELTLKNNALVQKDEALLAVKKSVNEVYSRLEGRFPKRDYDKIINVLNYQMSREEDRKDFERHFQRSQEGFYQKLRKRYPELSNNEMRLCSLLRMNMSTKEIADQLRITPKSAEVSRYRLRKKLNLDSTINLSKFFQEII